MQPFIYDNSQHFDVGNLLLVELGLFIAIYCHNFAANTFKKSQMNKNILQHTRKLVGLSENEVVLFNKYVETNQFKRKEFINQESSVCKQLYFVEKGCL